MRGGEAPSPELPLFIFRHQRFFTAKNTLYSSAIKSMTIITMGHAQRVRKITVS